MIRSNTKIPIQVKKRKQNKQCILRVTKSGVSVSVPFSISEKQIIAFIREKEQWIKLQWQAIQYHAFTFHLGFVFLFQGELYQLFIIKQQRKTLKISQYNNTWLFYVSDIHTEKQKQNYFKNWLKQQANIYFDERMSQIQNQEKVYEVFGKDIFKWRQRFLKTAFGICYPQKKEIVLNTELVYFSKDLVDFVIMHELTHFIHPNHSKAFYETLTHFMPQWKKKDIQLKKQYQMFGNRL